MAEVEQMKNTAEKILESVPKQKEVVDKTTVLLSELNPVYKEKKAVSYTHLTLPTTSRV